MSEEVDLEEEHFALKAELDGLMMMNKTGKQMSSGVRAAKVKELRVKLRDVTQRILLTGSDAPVNGRSGGQARGGGGGGGVNGKKRQHHTNTTASAAHKLQVQANFDVLQNNMWTYVFYTKIEDYRKKIKSAGRAAHNTGAAAADPQADAQRLSERHAGLVDSLRVYLDESVQFYTQLAKKLNDKYSTSKRKATPLTATTTTAMGTTTTPATTNATIEEEDGVGGGSGKSDGKSTATTTTTTSTRSRKGQRGRRARRRQNGDGSARVGDDDDFDDEDDNEYDDDGDEIENENRVVREDEDRDEDENDDNQEEEIAPECFKCYVCLGDLTRYSLQTNDPYLGAVDWTPAFKYYRQAATLRPDTGSPYNQLAVLAVYIEDAFLGLYYYHRSLAVDHPFITARANLMLLFEKNRQEYQSIAKLAQQQQQQGRQGGNRGGKGRNTNTNNNSKNTNKQNERGKKRNGRGGGGDNDKGSGSTPESTTSKKVNDATLMRDFRVTFVRLLGILFTQTGMELYPSVLEHFWKNMAAMMDAKKCFQIFIGEKSDTLEKSSGLAFQCVVGNIFAVHNVGYVPPDERKISDAVVSQSDIVRNSVFYRNAFMLAFGFAAILTKRVLRDGKIRGNQHQRSPSLSSSQQQQRRVFESPLLEPVLMMLDWLSHQPRFVKPDHAHILSDSGEQALRDDYWSCGVELLNRATAVDYEEWMESSLLAHDKQLVGFQPLVKFYRTLSMLRGGKGGDASSRMTQGRRNIALVRAARCVSAGRIIAKSGSDSTGARVGENLCPIVYDDLKKQFFTREEWRKRVTATSSPATDGMKKQITPTDRAGKGAKGGTAAHATGGGGGAPKSDAHASVRPYAGDDDDAEIIVFKATAPSAARKETFEIPANSFGTPVEAKTKKTRAAPSMRPQTTNDEKRSLPTAQETGAHTDDMDIGFDEQQEMVQQLISEPSAMHMDRRVDAHSPVGAGNIDRLGMYGSSHAFPQQQQLQQTHPTMPPPPPLPQTMQLSHQMPRPMLQSPQQQQQQQQQGYVHDPMYLPQHAHPMQQSTPSFGVGGDALDAAQPHHTFSTPMMRGISTDAVNAFNGVAMNRGDDIPTTTRMQAAPSTDFRQMAPNSYAVGSTSMYTDPFKSTAAGFSIAPLVNQQQQHVGALTYQTASPASEYLQPPPQSNSFAYENPGAGGPPGYNDTMPDPVWPSQDEMHGVSLNTMLPVNPFTSHMHK